MKILMQLTSPGVRALASADVVAGLVEHYLDHGGGRRAYRLDAMYVLYLAMAGDTVLIVTEDEWVGLGQHPWASDTGWFLDN